jgi:hypothetical protein
VIATRVGPPNKRVQRTRLRSPLTRHPLGGRNTIVALVLVGLQAAIATSVPSRPERTPTPSAAQQPVDAGRARQIAEKAFLNYTSRKVKTYSIKQNMDGKAEWEFYIQGTKTFARPGYYWIVKVNPESGVATVIGGE